MRIHGLGAGIVFVFLLVANPGWSQDFTEAAAKDLVTQETFRDVAPGALLIRDSSEVVLASDEDGSRLIGKIGWKGEKFQLGLEASSKLQEGAEEVELLNLDGVAGGATLTGQISYVHLQEREQKLFDSVCTEHNRLVACNLRLDRAGNSSGAKRSLDLCRCDATTKKLPPLDPASCTKAQLLELGFPWDEQVDDATEDALALGCSELSKLTGQAPLPRAFSQNAAELWPLAVTKACDNQGFEAAAQAAGPAWMAAKNAELEAQAKRLEAEKDRLLGIAASQGDASVKAEIESQAQEAAEGAVEARANAATLRLPPLLADPAAWLEAKIGEKLRETCRSFNAPATDLFLNTTGNDQECDLETLQARSEKLPSAHKARLRRIAVTRSNWIPWTFTLRGSAARQSFSFVEISDLGTSIKESENNTSFGFFASTLFEGTFYSLGIERKKEFEGQPKTTLCRPLAGTDAQVCNPAVLGGPEATESEVGRFEVRRFIATDFALAGRYFYDFDKDDWEVHTLLYFLRSEKRGLNGGIDLSYDSEDEWNARLFIGTSFNLEG